ncbi:MAG: DUF4912 domain-containing protein [Nostocales cyanobacterium]|nr:MAG: DUF4912 domain-containing protein [Nostocales cyanobacterium]TAF21327.1 MAG: DUF4912 domain-containing protein [Nostocales cyanobacterium]
MRKQKKNDNVILNLALSLALTTTPLSIGLSALSPVLAESLSENPEFSLPETVERGTKIRIDGDSNLLTINQTLKNNFEQQFSGTQVEISNNSSDEAIKNLLDGKIDIAAIGRELTPEEKSQGLEQVVLQKEKIAIIVSVDNPFSGNLTSQQFAQIFRGEITNWSELGGKSAKIRLIDYPENNETRNTFRTYPSFQDAEFSSGKNVTKIQDNQVTQVVKELGKEGISYALANQVSKLSDVKVLKIEGLTPDDAEYPFYQPLVYVYKKEPNLAISNFLGYALAPVGKQAITAARETEAAMIAARKLQNVNLQNAEDSTSENQSVLTNDNSEGTTNTVNSRNDQQFVTPVENNPFEDRTLIFLIALSSLPIIAFACVLAWWLRKKQPSTNQTPENQGLENQDQALTYINSNSAPVTETPEENLIIDPFDISNKGNGNGNGNGNSELLNKHNHENSTVVNSDNELVYITNTKPSESINGKTPINSLLQNELEKKTVIHNKVEQRNISEPNINLDCGEVIWDTEAPVAVVKNAYQSVSNITQIPVSDLQIAADDDINKSLSELLNEDTEISSANDQDFARVLNINSTSNSNSNSNLITQDAYTSLSELLNDDIDLLSNQQATNILQEIINNNPTLSIHKSDISLVDLLNENTTLAGNESTKLLLEKIGVLVARNDIDPNTPLSQLLDIFSDEHEQQEKSTQDALTSLLSSTNKSNTESINSLADLLGLSSPEQEKQNSERQDVRDESQKLLSELSNELNQVFNDLIDNNDLSADLPDELSLNVPVAVPNHSNSTIYEYINSEVNLNTEELIDLNYNVEDFDLEPTQITENIILDNCNSNIILTPRTPKWAYVSWYISPSHIAIAKNKGGDSLLVRLFDATDLDLSYQTPKLVQQYECEEIICDSYISIPTSNRDYLVEIGYLTKNNTWLCLARSGKVRIFSRPSGEFWFVADTELIIHGSTEPGATVTIGGNQIKLQPDGTFRLRVPFSENLLEYMMTATTADGESSISIVKKFFQENSEN